MYFLLARLLLSFVLIILLLTHPSGEATSTYSAKKKKHFQELAERAKRLIVLEDFENAVPLLEESLTLKPSSTKTANDLGVALLQWSNKYLTTELEENMEMAHSKLLYAKDVFTVALERLDKTRKPKVHKVMDTNLDAVLKRLDETNKSMEEVLFYKKNRPPSVPRISVSQLMDQRTDFFKGALPFVLVPDTTKEKQVGKVSRVLSIEMLQKEFPESIVDTYVNNMDRPSKKPFLLPMREAADRLLRAINAPGNKIPYLQWRASLDIWDKLERLYFGKLIPNWFRTDAVWLAGCLGSVSDDFDMLHEGYGSINRTGMANFMASLHWSVVSIGTIGSGMFFHADSIATSTYHLQLSGRKRWFICPPRGEESKYTTDGSRFLRFQAGEVDAFDPSQWLNTFPDFRHSVTACTETDVKPGEILYYPTDWWHQTLNLDDQTMGLAARRVDRFNYRKVYHSVLKKCLSPCNDITGEFPGAAPCLHDETCVRWSEKCLDFWKYRMFPDGINDEDVVNASVEDNIIREVVQHFRPSVQIRWSNEEL